MRHGLWTRKATLWGGSGDESLYAAAAITLVSSSCLVRQDTIVEQSIWTETETELQTEGERITLIIIVLKPGEQARRPDAGALLSSQPSLQVNFNSSFTIVFSSWKPCLLSDISIKHKYKVLFFFQNSFISPGFDICFQTWPCFWGDFWNCILTNWFAFFVASLNCLVRWVDSANSTLLDDFGPISIWKPMLTEAESNLDTINRSPL